MAPSSWLRQHLFNIDRHLHFRDVGYGFKMYEDTKWHNVISILKNVFGCIPISYIDFL